MQQALFLIAILFCIGAASAQIRPRGRGGSVSGGGNGGYEYLECKDTHSSCQSVEDICVKHQEFAAKNCSKTCGYCGGREEWHTSSTSNASEIMQGIFTSSDYFDTLLKLIIYMIDSGIDYFDLPDQGNRANATDEQSTQQPMLECAIDHPEYCIHLDTSDQVNRANATDEQSTQQSTQL
ncbi:unnamed protein product [Anisakis simplex]|uniref:ShKT domain-containing protein n=1 Tax=Anisakis simplex TaxID=6269 RepID=A0A0M3K5D2_ANISI|nr:unnamed protein product [Anisakis simplex]